VIALDRDQIGLLIEAAHAPTGRRSNRPSSAPCSNARCRPERHASAPTTRRAPTSNGWCCRPSSNRCASEWRNVQAAALLLANEGKLDAARAEVDAFHHRLCQIRVLDPACGSANFLYVTLEHMKRLEGEVLDQLHAFRPSFGQQRSKPKA
jgi:hypothetical protein